jgi:hypothetical protein
MVTAPPPLAAAFPASPVADETGNVTAPWRAFFMALLARTGASVGTDVAGVARTVTTETAARAAGDTALAVSIAAASAAQTAALAAEVARAEAAEAVLAQQLQSWGDQDYVFYQDVAASVWNVNHTLNRYPSVDVVDSAGNLVEGDVQYISPSFLTVTFAATFSGAAYLN